MFLNDMASNPHCRLCALKSENVIEVFQTEGTALDLALKIKQCLQILLSPDDVLPKTVCVYCCEKVLEFAEFFNNCSKSQECLINIFVGKNLQSECETLVTSKDINNMGFNLNTLNPEEHKAVLHVPSTCFVENEFSEEVQVSEPVQDEGLHIEPNISNESKFDSTRPKKVQKAVSSPEITDDQFNDDLEEESSNEFDEPSNSLGSLEKCLWKCASCDCELGSLAGLKSHYTTVHLQSPLYKCYHCDKVYSRYRSYSRHVKTHFAPKKYSCNICGKRFSQKTILQSHSTVHTDDRPHVCIHCGKAFKQFSSLYLHTKSHVPNRVKPKFPCTICPKEFSTKHTLDTHLKMHTGEKNFICDICGKRFVAKGSLDYHIMTHSEEKPHCCQVCGKSFKTGRLLSKHSTVHSGVKPHQCDVCGKQFRERGALKEHNRIHTGAMPYSCDFCGKLFRFKGILTVHRRLHTGERPYSCELCRREFTNWANYNKHMKRRHNDTASKRDSNKNTSEVVPAATAPCEELAPRELAEYDPLIHPTDLYREFTPTEMAPPAPITYYIPQHMLQRDH